MYICVCVYVCVEHSPLIQLCAQNIFISASILAFHIFCVL